MTPTSDAAKPREEHRIVKDEPQYVFRYRCACGSYFTTEVEANEHIRPSTEDSTNDGHQSES